MIQADPAGRFVLHVDLALDKIERQARKYKDKIRRYNPVKLVDEVS